LGVIGPKTAMANMDTTRKITTCFKLRISAALLLPLFMLAGLNTQAAVIDVQQKDWGKGKGAECCDSNFKVNFTEIKIDGKGGEKLLHSFQD
jgi:hypothetical protein